jgi:hypothetical protein
MPPQVHCVTEDSGSMSPMRAIFITALAFAITCSTLLAQASPPTTPPCPVFFGPGDPEIREIINTAAEFLTALGEGNETKARNLFVGTAKQAELMDAHVRLVRASGQLVPRLKSKFGDRPEFTALDARNIVAVRTEGLKVKFVIVNGDRAAVAAGLIYDRGMSLRRIDGKWRVEALSLRPRDDASLRVLMDALATAIANAHAMLARDEGVTWEQLSQEIESQFAPALQRSIESDWPRVAPIDPADAPSLPAGWTPISLERLRAAFAHKLTEPEASKLISSLPGLPIVTETRESIFVTSPEAGLSFHFAGKDGSLMSISFGNEGFDGYRVFRGDLPGKLSFHDVRRDVERKLGRPAQSSGGDLVEYSADYGGIYVGYQGSNLRDPANRIANVVLFSANPIAEQGVRSAPAPRPRLTLHLVAQPGRENDANVQRLQQLDNATLPVRKEVLLDDLDMEASYPMPARDATERDLIGLKMTPAGSAKLFKVTQAHDGESLAFVLDGLVLIAPRINGPIESKVTIDLGDQADRGFRDIARRIHLAISALPDEPATGVQGR